MMIKKTSDILSWLGGANIAILNRAPTTRGKFVQMGLVLLTTASIAVVSMSFFINHEVNEPEVNLDRFLVVSMGATRDRRRLLLMAAPRLCLAIVISLVVSTPITLRIFQSDINYQLRVSQANQSAYLSQQEAKSGLSLQAKQLAAQIAQDQSTLDGSLPQTITNPQLQTAQQQVQQLRPQVNKAKAQEIAAYEAWQCELYGDGPGCAGASNRTGNGPIAQAKQQTYQQDVNTYNALYGQLQTAEHNESTAEAGLKQAQGAALTRYQTAARKALPRLQKQYSTIEGEITAAHAADQTAINQHTGTLAQLSALWATSAGNAVLLLAHLTVMALFFFIELLPVLIKILLNLGPLDAYERVLKVEEEKIGDQVRMERLIERRKADADSRALIKVAEDKSNREQTLGIRANAYVAKRMEAILDAALQQWSTQVTALLNNAPVNTGGVQSVGPTMPVGATGPTMPNGSGGPTPAGPTPAGAPSAGGLSPGAATNGASPSPNGTPPNGIGLPPAGSML
jgi:Domain of unknown function (DUF4407)